MNGDGDNETWLTGWEQECADEIEEQPDYEQSFVTEQDSSHRKIWTAFQDSATAIAQLYRGSAMMGDGLFLGYGCRRRGRFYSDIFLMFY